MICSKHDFSQEHINCVESFLCALVSAYLKMVDLNFCFSTGVTWCVGNPSRARSSYHEKKKKKKKKNSYFLCDITIVLLAVNTKNALTSSQGDSKLIQWVLSAPRISLNAPR